MSIISYENFKANALPGDLSALATLLAGERIATTDPVEAANYQAVADRLYQPGVEVLTKVTRSVERIAGQEWVTFEARVDPVAVGYVARLAGEALPTPP